MLTYKVNLYYVFIWHSYSSLVESTYIIIHNHIWIYLSTKRFRNLSVKSTCKCFTNVS